MYFLKKIIPKSLFLFFQPGYHYLLAFFGALIYRFPSRKIFVVGITGTKGKTTVAEIINAILERAGFKIAMMNSLRFRVLDNYQKNILKMTMPGRFLIQKFLKKAVNAKCDYFILETTSEGIKQFRHKFIAFKAAIFTNLAPEHIESHGSFENYKKAKLKLFNAAKNLHIVNLDSEHSQSFLSVEAKEKWGYGIKSKIKKQKAKIINQSLKILETDNYNLSENGIDFEIDGLKFHSDLIGEFNLQNILAAIAFVRSQNIEWEIIKEAIENFHGAEGRMEFINKGQLFKVVVDYAHTPDSLEAVYKTLTVMKSINVGERSADNKLICVLGSCGGGRDKWKRPEMGKIAAKYCDEIILTNEDPYDENPTLILKEIEAGFSPQFLISNFKFSKKPNIQKILDRREAIRKAIKSAKENDTVIITGKGAEPWIMGKNGTKIPWDDRKVAEEEIGKSF